MGNVRVCARALAVSGLVLALSACGQQQPSVEAQVRIMQPPITGFTLTNMTTKSGHTGGVKALAGVEVRTTQKSGSTAKIQLASTTGTSGEEIWSAPSGTSIPNVVKVLYDAVDGSGKHFTFYLEVADKNTGTVFLGQVPAVVLEDFAPSPGEFVGQGMWVVSCPSKGLKFN